MEKLSDKARLYARAYEEPPTGREVEGTVELLLQMADKLEQYENLEEQGKLLKLPCAVGDEVYRIIKEFHTGMKKIISGKVYRIAISYTEIQIFIDKWQSKGIFGKTVFLSKEEAEAVLKNVN